MTLGEACVTGWLQAGLGWTGRRAAHWPRQLFREEEHSRGGRGQEAGGARSRGKEGQGWVQEGRGRRQHVPVPRALNATPESGHGPDMESAAGRRWQAGRRQGGGRTGDCSWCREQTGLFSLPIFSLLIIMNLRQLSFKSRIGFCSVSVQKKDLILMNIRKTRRGIPVDNKPFTD